MLREGRPLGSDHQACPAPYWHESCLPHHLPSLSKYRAEGTPGNSTGKSGLSFQERTGCGPRLCLSSGPAAYKSFYLPGAQSRAPFSSHSWPHDGVIVPILHTRKLRLLKKSLNFPSHMAREHKAWIRIQVCVTLRSVGISDSNP